MKTSAETAVRVGLLEKKLGITFKSKQILELALMHKSFGHEHRVELPISVRDNERLEFLGDAILDFIVSDILFQMHQNQSEGELSKLRATIVNDKQLFQIAKELELGEFALLGRGEEHTGGRDKESILASIFEALVAAIYLDQGFAKARAWVQERFSSIVNDDHVAEEFTDYKTRLQEWSQSKHRMTPTYSVMGTTGPDHEKIFTIEVTIEERVLGRAEGKSKKEAEQAAAKLALELVKNK